MGACTARDRRFANRNEPASQNSNLTGQHACSTGVREWTRYAVSPRTNFRLRIQDPGGLALRLQQEVAESLVELGGNGRCEVNPVFRQRCEARPNACFLDQSFHLLPAEIVEGTAGKLTATVLDLDDGLAVSGRLAPDDSQNKPPALGRLRSRVREGPASFAWSQVTNSNSCR